MRVAIHPLSVLALGLAATPAWAVDTTLTSAGYTGLGITPSAQILGWGRMATSYENQLAGNRADVDGHNLVLGFGLLPNLEIAGRLATNTLHADCFTANCGTRDLSASGKVGIGLDAGRRWSVAVGATDVGGSVTHFRSYYGVLTYDNGPFQGSAGVARRSKTGVGGSESPLQGVFASLAWQPIPLVRGQVETSDGKAWAGVRLFAPQAWLPEGWSLSAGANARLTDTPLTKRNWWDASLSIPLYKVPAMPGSTEAPLTPLGSGQLAQASYEARALPGEARDAMPDQPRHGAGGAAGSPARGASPVASASPGATVVPSGSASLATAVFVPPRDARLWELATALEAKGLEDISVGRMPDGTIAVRANNGAYEWNAVDALGVALGAIARTLSDTKAGYRLILTQRQVPLVAVTGQADCLRQWIEQPTNTCTAGQLSTPGSAALEPLHDGAVWVVSRQKPAWQTVRVNVSPVLLTNVGTEVGALDAALGASVDALLPLWSGASVDWGVTVPIERSANYDPGAIFGNRRIRSGTERLAFTQTARVPLEQWLPSTQAQRSGASALTAQVTAGRIGTFYDGAIGGLRWEPGEGRHRLAAEAGAFRNNSFEGGFGPLGTVRTAKPVLASYRYSVMATRTDLEATGGQFMNNDRGVQLGLRQWFADASVGVYYKRTTSTGSPARQLVGVELSFPIGPRRDWQPLPHLQLGGTTRFTHAVETSIHEGAGNPLRLGRGVLPPTPDLDAVFNSDRSSLAYFEDNLRRIKDAARN